eukprot:scaffold215982_cov15-Tisochrysis_lutea.AAC.1
MGVPVVTMSFPATLTSLLRHPALSQADSQRVTLAWQGSLTEYLRTAEISAKLFTYTNTKGLHPRVLCPQKSIAALADQPNSVKFAWSNEME